MKHACLSHHGKVGAGIRAALFVVVIPAGLLIAAIPTFASPATLHCGPNDDRVWLYDSLTNFNVVERLDCGATVEVESRAPGYVKVRSSDGQEGYVPLNALPQLPPPPAGTDANGAPHQPTLAEAAALARRRYTAYAANSPAAPPAASAPAPARAPVAAAPVTQPAVEAVAANANLVAMQPVAVAEMQPIAQPVAAPPAVALRSAAMVAAKRSPRPAAHPVAVAPPPAVPTPSRAAVSVAANVPAAVAEPASAAPAPEATAEESEPEIVLTSAPEAPPAPAAAPPMPAPSAPVSASPAPAAPAIAAAPAPAAVPAVPERDGFVSNPAAPLVHTPARGNDDDPDDDGDDSAQASAPANRANCTAYFSAYGLSPNQYKWIETNRKKFPGICPAPTPALVDFVVIFTHDVNFYNFTMPAPVRTDASGLSDWTPMRTEDSALVPFSQMDKNHHEYVWVFHTRRGAFDPARFSSKRHPQFEKSESNVFGSHAGDRTAEAALHFIADNRGIN
ncbi:MAG TPA: SH3 domain-containing protein [Verrucomicrobiae bacterium]|nr:SH3 domain-containing protein [Verrucomicrobiae bacterium]